ncbi:NAD(P)-binding protein [Hypoxylon trugodes]|uniref:NAD(P)-binding protein n=1 Tax=Hypoxylon trugodes TaxID=326681 RepID=UPI0021A1E0F6|nr:NAD(P)-binding protein [Hypoxylon trugodes]KAI1387868.1 NAD(P)-binding protein [Hypoxylon trugodes]
MASLRKSVLITGCTDGGIGAALAEVFHEKGYHVFATLRNLSKLPRTLSGAANVTPLNLDVTSSESIAAAVESVTKETDGRLDILVNNSGVNFPMPALDTPIAEAKALFDINFWGALAMLQAFAPLLIKAKGCLVNNASANAISPMAFLSTYNSSKAALATGSETWRHELKPLGVRTLTLITCAVRTHNHLKTPRLQVPETSHYYAIRDFIHSILDGRLQNNAITARQYATKVVREIEKGSTGMVWVGTSASLFHWVWWLSPKSIFDMVIESVVPAQGEMAKVSGKKKA